MFNNYHGIIEDDANYSAHRVLFSPAGTPLQRHPLPDHQPDENRIPACRLTFSEHLSVPALESPWRKPLAAVGERWEEYLNLTQGLHPAHHLLGYPQPIQGDILTIKTRRHLLTLAGDPAPEWEFMDGGALYYTLSAGDLAKGRLERVAFELQSG